MWPLRGCEEGRNVGRSRWVELTALKFIPSEKEKAYITEGSRVVSYLNTNSARWCLTSRFEMGRGGSTIA